MQQAIDKIRPVVRVERIVLVHGEGRAFFRRLGVQDCVVPLHRAVDELLHTGDHPLVEEDAAPRGRVKVRVVHEDRPRVEPVFFVEVAIAPGAAPADGLLSPLLDYSHHLRGQLCGFLGREELGDFEVALFAVVRHLFLAQHV